MPAQASLRPSQMIALNLAGAHRKLSHFSLRIFAAILFFPFVDAGGRDSTRGWIRVFSSTLPLRLINIGSTCRERKVNIARVTLLVSEKNKDETKPRSTDFYITLRSLDPRSKPIKVERRFELDHRTDEHASLVF